jgi:hypothetical protein
LRWLYQVASNRKNGRRKAPQKSLRKQRRAGQRASTSAPAAYSAGYEFKRPAQGNFGAAYRVSHSELLTTVVGSEDYAFANFKINPGLLATFPWLATIALKYEQYTVRMMRFRFVTRVGTGTHGSVILSPDYDAGDAPPTTEQEATSTANAKEDVPWKNFAINLSQSSMHPNGNRKFTRGGNVVGDVRNFDVGQLTIATVGMSNANAVGKLWVDYVIDFFVPQNTPPPPPPLPGVSVFEFDTSQPVAIDVVEPAFPSLPPLVDTLLLGPTDAKGNLTLPPGNYSIASNYNVFDEKAGATESVSASRTQLWVDGIAQAGEYVSQALQGANSPGVQNLLEEFITVPEGTTKVIRVLRAVIGLTPFLTSGTKMVVRRY